MSTRIATFLKGDPDALKNLLARYEKGDLIFRYIVKRMKKREMNDEKILARARKKFPKLGYSSDHAGRAKSRILQIEKLIGGYLYASGIKYYLDIGVGNGSIPNQMAQMYGKISCYGIDIADERVYRDGYVFKEYDGVNIPFQGFDLITVMMVLHHVKDIDGFMKSLANSSEKYVFIREHNVETEKDEQLIRIQHDLFDRLYTKSVIYSGDQHFHFMSKADIVKSFDEHGFDLVRSDEKKTDPTKVYHALFKKRDVVLHKSMTEK